MPSCFRIRIIQAHGEDVLLKTSLGRGHYNFKAMTKIQFKSIETVLQCQDDGKIMPMQVYGDHFTMSRQW